MSAQRLAVISAALTALLVILFSILLVFVQVIALNGASERQGLTAIMLSLTCQGIMSVLASMLAWRLTNLLITKFNWNAILAVVIAVIAGTFGGGLLSFLSLIIAIPLAGIR